MKKKLTCLLSPPSPPRWGRVTGRAPGLLVIEHSRAIPGVLTDKAHNSVFFTARYKEVTVSLRGFVLYETLN